MIGYLNYTINPYKGIGNILFGAKIGDIKEKLKAEKIPFVQSVYLNKCCTPEIPWFYITIDSGITLCTKNLELSYSYPYTNSFYFKKALFYRFSQFGKCYAEINKVNNKGHEKPLIEFFWPFFVIL